MKLSRAAQCCTVLLACEICALLWSQWALTQTQETEKMRGTVHVATVHVALIFDVNRATYAAQVLRSLHYHNPATQFVFHLVTDEQSQAQLQMWFKGSGSLRFYNHTLCQDLVAPVLAFSEPTIHISAHCKAFLSSILDADRVIYIDTDVTAVGDVSACYHHRFEKTQFIGMVVDMGDVCQYWPDR